MWDSTLTVLFFRHFECVIHYPSACMVSAKKSAVHLLAFTRPVMFLFPLSRFSLSLAIKVFAMMCLGVGFFACILCGSHRASRMHLLMFLINFGKLQHLFFKYFFLLLSSLFRIRLLFVTALSGGPPTWSLRRAETDRVPGGWEGVMAQVPATLCPYWDLVEFLTWRFLYLLYALGTVSRDCMGLLFF